MIQILLLLKCDQSIIVFTGQVNTLTKLLKSEKTPLLRNLITLPLLVQQEPDPVVQVIITVQFEAEGGGGGERIGTIGTVSSF